MTNLPNLEKVFKDISKSTAKGGQGLSSLDTQTSNISARLNTAVTIGAWSISDFKKANHEYQFSFDEINVLTINALNYHNQELFTYLYRNGYGLNSVETSYNPELQHIQKKYTYDIFKETESLRIFLEAGGKLFRKLENKNESNGQGPMETMIFDFLTLSGDRDVLPALEDLDKNLLAHVYINECFDANGDSIHGNLQLFCRSLLPALFTTRKHLASDFNSAQIHPEELKKMLDKGPLPLGTVFVFLRSLFLENDFEYKKTGHTVFSSLEYAQEIVSTLCKSYEFALANAPETPQSSPAYFIIDEYNQGKSMHEQFTYKNERNLLEIMTAYYELSTEQSYSIQAQPLGDVLSEFKGNISQYKALDSMCSSALSNMLVSRILNHEPASDWEEHPASNADNLSFLSNFKTRIACKCWAPEIMEIPEKNIHLPFYALFLNKVIDENSHWKKNYDRIALLKKSEPIIDELFGDLVDGKSVDEKVKRHEITYMLAYRQLLILNHMKKMPTVLLESVYSNTSENFREHLFIQTLHKDLLKRKLSSKHAPSPRSLSITRF